MAGFTIIPGVGAPQYKDPVADFASLPASAQDGEVRVALDTYEIYVYNAGTDTWVSPTGGTGILNLNGQSGNSQTLVAGTSGTDFNISSAANVHTFNIPDASGTARGLITTGAQTLAGNKTFSGTISTANTIDAPNQYIPEERQISAGEATAKALTLTSTPKNVTNTILIPQGGTAQNYGIDFVVVGASLSWSGLGLDSLLTAGDVVTIIHDQENNKKWHK